jgi:hypothetical protein
MSVFNVTCHIQYFFVTVKYTKLARNKLESFCLNLGKKMILFHNYLFLHKTLSRQ